MQTRQKGHRRAQEPRGPKPTDKNHRGDIYGDIGELRPPSNKGKRKADLGFFEGEAAAQPEPIWTRIAKHKGLTPHTVDGLLTHSWKGLAVEDAEETISLYPICLVYAVAMQAILKLKVW